MANDKPTTQYLEEAADGIIAESSVVANSVRDLIDDKFGWSEIWMVLVALVRAAENIHKDIKGAGASKHTLVREVWKELDEKYGLIDKLDDLIHVPFWLEPFDKKLIKILVDVIISGIVTVLNLTGVFR